MPINKIDRKELKEMLVDILSKSATFKLLSKDNEVNPCRISFDGMGFYIYIKNLSPLIPVLKQYQHIYNLTELVSKSDFKEIMNGETVLIIDDEADQASLNSYGRKNSKKNDDEEKQVSSTYDSILRWQSQYGFQVVKTLFSSS